MARVRGPPFYEEKEMYSLLMLLAVCVVVVTVVAMKIRSDNKYEQLRADKKELKRLRQLESSLLRQVISDVDVEPYARVILGLVNDNRNKEIK